MRSRPARDRVLLETAKIWAKRGTCSRAQVGAVISREGRILVQGYNGTPAGMEHCNHDCICGMSDPVYLAPEYHLKQCHFVQPCMTAVHAEANAIAYAAKVGVSTENTELHTTMTPCINCAMLIVNAGVKRVIYIEEYRDNSGLILLRRAKIEIEQYDMIEA